jgi:hypothetical protein
MKGLRRLVAASAVRVTDQGASPVSGGYQSARFLRSLGVKKHGRIFMRCGIIVALGVAAWLFGHVDADAQTLTTPSPKQPSATSTPASTPTDQGSQIQDLQNRVSDLEEIIQLVLGPIAILIGILSLGGALGVVFSLRDQRRLSQFHQLAVSSEVSSQRRTELSYSSFLEESQKTLTLVNQTLALAREATDQAAHTMERKAATSLSNIETDARDALEPLLDAGEFEDVVDDPDVRTKLEAIAGELRAIEGYLLLQDIDLQPYSRYVKGMVQYLTNDTTGALRTLRHAAQDSSVRELQLFAIYWDAYLNMAMGSYLEAEHVFELGREHLAERTMESVEFRRMIDDTRFFKAAARLVSAAPVERLKGITVLLIDLENASKDAEADTRISRELAETRGDLLSWISYQDNRVYGPLPEGARSGAVDLDSRLKNIASIPGKDELIPIGTLNEIAGIEEVLRAQSEDTIRVWALMQARRIYYQERDVSSNPEHNEEALDLALAFGKAECDFVLGSLGNDACADAYKLVERRAIDQLGSHREQRRAVELAELDLICACRLLYLYRQHPAGGRDSEVRNQETEVKNKYLRMRERLWGMRDHKLTITSQLQRRPLSQSELEAEAREIVRQATGESV